MVKENKRFRFNIIDLIILLFIILAVIGIIWRYDIADDLNFNANSEQFEIEFIIKNVYPGTDDYFQAGEKFYINIERTEIGTVKELIDVSASVEYVERVNGEIVKSFKSDRIDIRGKMISTGRTTKEGNIMINGNIFVAHNKEFYINTGKRECWINVTSINKIN